MLKSFLFIGAIWLLPSELFSQKTENNAAGTASQVHKLEKLWETDTIVAVPESVFSDTKRNVLFVSLVDGGGWIDDGKGGIGKLTRDGKKYDSAYVTGLSAPKGMGIIGNKLYVTNMIQVLVINIPDGKIEKKIQIDSAKGLNDITTAGKNKIYVSDSRGGKVWLVENDIPSLYVDNVTGVNGVKAIGDDLYIGVGKKFIKADKKKNITEIAEVTQNIDGIEPVGNGDFILTAWAGYIWYVYADGRVETLLETHQQKKNTADIGYDPQKRLVYVPTFNGKTVVCYHLE